MFFLNIYISDWAKGGPSYRYSPPETSAVLCLTEMSLWHQLICDFAALVPLHDAPFGHHRQLFSAKSFTMLHLLSSKQAHL